LAINSRPRSRGEDAFSFWLSQFVAESRTPRRTPGPLRHHAQRWCRSGALPVLTRSAVRRAFHPASSPLVFLASSPCPPGAPRLDVLILLSWLRFPVEQTNSRESGIHGNPAPGTEIENSPPVADFIASQSRFQFEPWAYNVDNLQPLLHYFGPKYYLKLRYQLLTSLLGIASIFHLFCVRYYHIITPQSRRSIVG
jgi:hypothetical protein